MEGISIMKFAPYSFSKINLFETCPMKFKFQYIDKIRTPFKMNDVLEKGSYIHLILEKLAKNDMVLPEVKYNFRHSTEEQVKEYNVIAHDFIFSEIGYNYLQNEEQKFFGAEVEFGIKVEDGKLASTSYWNKKALFRGKIDHANMGNGVMHLLDWKSGKVSGFPAPLQLVMYAVWCFLEFPEIHTVETAFVYVEHEEEKRYVFTRDMLGKLSKKMLEKVYNIEHEEKFEKKESKLCEYCEFRLQGLCEETSNTDFNDTLSKFNPTKKDKQNIWFYMHPESGSAWRQDFELLDHDGLVEEIDETTWWNLDEQGYVVDRDIIKKENI